MAADSGQRSPIDSALAVPLGGQEGVLHGEKFPVQRHGRADIHQGTQKPPLGRLVFGKADGLTLVSGHFSQQGFIECLYLF